MIKSKYQQLAPLFLRLIIGFGFMAHGWAKISRGTGGFEKLLTQAGVPFPHLNALIAPYVELLGGLAIILGAYTAVVAVPLIITMLVAMFYVQGNYGFSAVKTIGLTPEGPQFGPPGYEINLLYIGGLLSLMITGAGAISIDAWRLRKKS
ncbi:DoxX family protein [Chitinophaga agrisoli]|uniref:DoxX family protein n=1 Tax=Chitinophaga agrisoli TaxID=2607653 RepID=A0A5B2VLS2_9BACT|nr:DoxX family protein [Chitinophaga agrisoli]KAA2239272.1 DoxX family protein [Chitinophaga agrisoli]